MDTGARRDARTIPCSNYNAGGEACKIYQQTKPAGDKIALQYAEVVRTLELLTLAYGGVDKGDWHKH